MTAFPRALIGPVLAMARPARPAAEIIAVREAAAMVRLETNLSSIPAVAREIAARVVEAMLADIERDDALSIALAAIERQLAPSPLSTLATCPEINTAEGFVERRAARLRARSGRYLTPAQQDAERKAIAADITGGLSRRRRLLVGSSEV